MVAERHQKLTVPVQAARVTVVVVAQRQVLADLADARERLCVLVEPGLVEAADAVGLCSRRELSKVTVHQYAAVALEQQRVEKLWRLIGASEARELARHLFQAVHAPVREAYVGPGRYDWQLERGQYAVRAVAEGQGAEQVRMLLRAGAQ